MDSQYVQTKGISFSLLKPFTVCADVVRSLIMKDLETVSREYDCSSYSLLEFDRVFKIFAYAARKCTWTNLTKNLSFTDPVFYSTKTEFTKLFRKAKRECRAEIFSSRENLREEINKEFWRQTERQRENGSSEIGNDLAEQLDKHHLSENVATTDYPLQPLLKRSASKNAQIKKKAFHIINLCHQKRDVDKKMKASLNCIEELTDGDDKLLGLTRSISDLVHADRAIDVEISTNVLDIFYISERKSIR